MWPKPWCADDRTHHGLVALRTSCVAILPFDTFDWLRRSEPSFCWTPHSICTTFWCMKTAQLPPVRVEPSVREEIEAVLHDGESLSEFVEAAAVQTARRRKAQEEFLARGRASLARAKRTGEFYVADKVLEDMRGRLLLRTQALRKAKSKSKSTVGAKR